jgi:chromosome segregation ATPase
MADFPSILESLATGILSGGTAALTSVLGVFRDLRKRLKEVEEHVGAPATPTAGASGIYQVLTTLGERIEKAEETAKRLQKDLEEMEDTPPDWVVRMVARQRNSTSVNMEVQQEFENRMESRLRTIQDRLMRELEDLKDELSGLKKDLRDLDERFVPKDAYVQDSRRRADELSNIKESLAAANGLLRGVLGALGLIGPDNNGRR